MLFNSFSYFAFLPLIVGIYYLLPHRFRWVLLLAGSYFFYGCWRVEYLGLIVLSTLVDYMAGLKMGGLPDKKQRRPWLALSLIVNLGTLFFFKYFLFFSTSAASLFEGIDSPTLQLLLPVGISYYTFQTLSYSIDVYRGELKPERRLGHFALYVSFFPQLVAGPIERAGKLLPQFDREVTFEYDRFRDGLKQILLGLFKKMVLADTLALVVDPIFDHPEGIPGPMLMMGAVLFAFQIYYDFSGYCHIAVGTAQLLGLKLADNFNLPYQSGSMREMWTRWNITLSNWFRDYVYLPLGGNRVSKPRWIFNVSVVFLLSGWWHGANWTFLVWGGLHAVFYLLSPKKTTDNPWLKRIQVILTFVLFAFAFIFFRAKTIGLGWAYVLGMGQNWSWDWTGTLEALHIQPQHLWLSAIGVGGMSLLNQFIKKERIRALFSEKAMVLRWAFYLILGLSILLLGNFGQKPFIYFQF